MGFRVELTRKRPQVHWQLGLTGRDSDLEFKFFKFDSEADSSSSYFKVTRTTVRSHLARRRRGPSLEA
jgi:hypothetical protein